MKAVENFQYMPSGLGVQRAGRLVGHDNGRVGGDGPGDGYPLLLAAGHLAGLVGGAVKHGHPLQGRLAALVALIDADALVDKRQLHVLPGGEGGNEVVALKDKADLLIADVGQLTVTQLGDVGAVQMIVAISGDVQTAQDVHQGGFA